MKLDLFLSVSVLALGLRAVHCAEVSGAREAFASARQTQGRALTFNRALCEDVCRSNNQHYLDFKCMVGKIK